MVTRADWCGLASSCIVVAELFNHRLNIVVSFELPPAEAPVPFSVDLTKLELLSLRCGNLILGSSGREPNGATGCPGTWSSPL
jgi:hypothetical protein